jgi:hypothetical protein
MIPVERLAVLSPLSVQAADAGMFQLLKGCRDGQSFLRLAAFERAFSDAS